MKQIAATLLIVTNMLLLTGCWGMREIDDLGLVMAVGIDKEAGSNDYALTVQIAKLASPEGGGGEEGGGKGESKGSKIWIGTARGKTLFEATRELSQISSKRIMWAHNNLIIIGESLARDGILPVIDFFTHNPELRAKTFVVVAKGDAKQYLAATTGLDEIPGLGLREMYRYQLLSAKSVQSNMLRVNRSYFSEDRQPVIAGIDFRREVVKPGAENAEKEAKVIVVGGAAVFKGDIMIGWLTPEETRGLAWLLNETSSTLVTVAVPGNANKSVSVETGKVKTKIETAVADGVPTVTISVSGDAHIVEEDSATDLAIEAFKEAIQKSVEEQIAAEIALTVGKVQKDYKSDVLDFGANLHAQHKKEWYQIRKQWESLFPDIPVRIAVNIKIKSSTLLQLPLRDSRKWAK